MNRDLSIIKKKYGEEMMHFCRDNFSTILETEGLLSKILLENFHESHSLYDDLVNNSKEDIFKNYIYKIYGDLVFSLNNFQVDHHIEETPEELMDKAGYVLRECLTEEDIQSYRKYYAEGEEICTFKGGRLNKCRVFFAVKKNVDQIKRKNFSKPRRQDEYGTSVISIQFTKDGTNTLSIKNRYNHIVSDCDSTFSNDLDNIIAGLTDSFANTYGLVQKYSVSGFEVPGYVRAKDGKFYKYNYEINNVYYCPDNIIIDNFKVKRFDKSKYIILDYFILSLDKSNKGVTLYDKTLMDSFPKIFNDVDKIDISNIATGKIIKVTSKDGNVIEIIINKDNKIIGLNIGKIKEVGLCFLYRNESIQSFSGDFLEIINNNFIPKARELTTINIPKVKIIKDNSLTDVSKLEIFNAPDLRQVGNSCLTISKKLVEFNASNLEIVGSGFLRKAYLLKKFYTLKLKYAGDTLLASAPNLLSFDAPNLKCVGDYCLAISNNLVEFDASNLEIVGNNFLSYAYKLRDFYVLKLKSVGDTLLASAPNLLSFDAPNLEKIGNTCLTNANKLINFNAPKLFSVGGRFLTNSLMRDSVLEMVSKNAETKEKRSKYVELREELLKGIDSSLLNDGVDDYGGRKGK